jgi:hypothetical protein
MSHTAKDLRLTALLIASLGADSEDRMLAGETFSFKGGDPAYRDIIEQMYARCVDKTKIDNHNLPSPTAEYIDSAVVNIKLVDKGENGDTRLSAFLSPIMYTPKSWGSGWINTGAYSLDGKIPGLPPRPKEATCPSLQDDMANSAMVPLDRYTAENWKSPLLQAKIDIDKPDTIRHATFADLISAVAKASGLNVVTEDFTSHRRLEGSNPTTFQNMDRLFVKQTNAASTLTSIRPQKYILDTDYVWFFNEEDNLLIGWADTGPALGWRDHHRQLVSAGFLDDLKSKLNGPGLELDDVVPLMSIQADSYNMWIRHSNDLTAIGKGINIGSPDWISSSTWNLYGAFDTSDKELAKSDGGLCLAKFDPQFVSSFFKAQKLQASPDAAMPLSLIGQSRANSIEKYKQRAQDFDWAMSDPQVLSTMVMRVMKLPATSRWCDDKGFVAVPPELKLSKYDIVLAYRADGEDHIYTVSGPMLAFPVWSKTREAEIFKASQ